MQHLLEQFWKHWRQGFLPSLNVLKQWFHVRHSLKEGDVLIVNPNPNRGDWPLSCEAYPWDDGLVRVVKVKMKNKEYLHPVHHLCPQSM